MVEIYGYSRHKKINSIDIIRSNFSMMKSIYTYNFISIFVYQICNFMNADWCRTIYTMRLQKKYKSLDFLFLNNRLDAYLLMINTSKIYLKSDDFFAKIDNSN